MRGSSACQVLEKRVHGLDGLLQLRDAPDMCGHRLFRLHHPALCQIKAALQLDHLPADALHKLLGASKASRKSICVTNWRTGCW